MCPPKTLKQKKLCACWYEKFTITNITPSSVYFLVSKGEKMWLRRFWPRQARPWLTYLLEGQHVEEAGQISAVLHLIRDERPSSHVLRFHDAVRRDSARNKQYFTRNKRQFNKRPFCVFGFYDDSCGNIGQSPKLRCTQFIVSEWCTLYVDRTCF